MRENYFTRFSALADSTTSLRSLAKPISLGSISKMVLNLPTWAGVPVKFANDFNNL